MAKKSKTSQQSNKLKRDSSVTGYSTQGSLFKNIPVRELKQPRQTEQQTDPAVPKDPEDTLTPKQAAALLKRSIRRVSYYRREGLIKGFWKFQDGRVLYSRAGIEEFFRNHFHHSED
ncbi:helix-turn-helix domain-containing protein [Leptospira noguchii]|uniref:helix-turn-helix domain-containing protein n=1 Tax=Leptospira noguchii TaxID=28182 RepID=UPI001FB702DC|nr:helix-turn-helix domain-containing protein [Leptospira noguchii]UOG39348.1 helix-turn-helix domain-containing protein [Leptospira noguchii]